jgi:hypothetical protein
MQWIQNGGKPLTLTGGNGRKRTHLPGEIRQLGRVLSFRIRFLLLSNADQRSMLRFDLQFKKK